MCKQKLQHATSYMISDLGCEINTNHWTLHPASSVGCIIKWRPSDLASALSQTYIYSHLESCNYTPTPYPEILPHFTTSLEKSSKHGKHRLQNSGSPRDQSQVRRDVENACHDGADARHGPVRRRTHHLFVPNPALTLRYISLEVLMLITTLASDLS